MEQNTESNLSATSAAFRLAGRAGTTRTACYELTTQKPAVSGSRDSEFRTDSGLRPFKPALCLANLRPGTIRKFLVKPEVLWTGAPRYVLHFQTMLSWVIRHCRTGSQPLTRQLEASLLWQFTGWGKRPVAAFAFNQLRVPQFGQFHSEDPHSLVQQHSGSLHYFTWLSWKQIQPRLVHQ